MKKILLILIITLISSVTVKASSYDDVENFSFIDLDGKKHSISDYQGKWLLVNYWASYCPPCLAEIPDIERFYKKNKKKFMVLGMDAGGNTNEDILRFKKENGITYPLIPMQESTMLGFGILMGIPTSFVISPKGKIVDKYVGIITYSDLDYLVNGEGQ